MIAHDCTRQTELVSFIQCQQPTAKSGWFLDYFFRDRRTQAEKLEIRKYSKASAVPLFYTGACLPPTLIKAPTESLSLQELTWPTIKAETKITGCDVDERRIMPNGDLIPVGLQRFNEAFNYQMMGVMDSLRATHIGEAITLLKTGGYILRSSETENLGTVDFQRNAALSAIDLVGTNDDFCNQCSNPFGVFEDIGREMGICGGLAGSVDIIYGEAAWKAVSAHEERDAVKYSTRPGASFDRSLSGNASPFFAYNDIQFKGETNGGALRHWVSFAQYLDHTGAVVPVLAPGEVLIVSRDAFDGQRVYRTVSSDNREFIPDGGFPFFVYDDLEKEYNRKCRAFEPWIEEHHLLVPGNVNGAVLFKATADTCEPCINCEECP